MDADQLLMPMLTSPLQLHELHKSPREQNYSVIHELYVEENVTKITKLEEQGWAEGQWRVRGSL
jgi:hypothetical protein